MADKFDRPLLILDLDETLVFGAENALDRPCDFRVGPYFVYKRPGLDGFLTQVRQWFELAIWSSASLGYVYKVARAISNSQIEWRFVYTRVECVQKFWPETWSTKHLKDLKKVKRLGFPLEQVLIVDDTPHKVARNYGNAIYVSAYEGETDDDELVWLGQYLESIKDHDNFRTLEKRGWRSRILQTFGDEELPA